MVTPNRQTAKKHPQLVNTSSNQANEMRDKTRIKTKPQSNSKYAVAFHPSRTQSITQKGKKPIDITGQIFGRLTALKSIGKSANGSYLWKCKCSCKDANIVKVNISNLRNGHTQSCGCLQREATINTSTTHGASYTSTYKIHQGIIKRCYNKNAINYKDYGGRGITVDKHWLGNDGFSNFLADMGERPPGMMIDRRDNDDNYTPNNCHWVTPLKSGNNKRNTLWITMNGKTRSLSIWCRKYGFNYHKVYKYMVTSKISAKAALLHYIEQTNKYKSRPLIRILPQTYEMIMLWRSQRTPFSTQRLEFKAGNSLASGWREANHIRDLLISAGGFRRRDMKLIAVSMAGALSAYQDEHLIKVTADRQELRRMIRKVLNRRLE
jgi:hypothetical protein